MKSYAVIFTYSFDNDVAVYLFDTEEEAKQFLKGSFEEEVRIDTAENGGDCESYISEDGDYASITNYFLGREPDVTEFRIGNVYC